MEQQAGNITPGLPQFDGRAVIAGVRQDAEGGATLPSISPATGQVIAQVAQSSAADVDRAVTGAAEAFSSGVWSNADATERKRVLLAIADGMEAEADSLARMESFDMGKPLSQARAVDVDGAIATFRWYAELVDKLHDEVPATPAGSMALVERVPLGVVGAIVPWNYPLEIAAWKLAPALAMGNSVVLKPAELSSLTALRLGDIAAAAGLPAGVLHVIPGSGAVAGDALARHLRVDALTFTGSTATAQKLMVAAGQSSLKRLALEAGGKSANLVFADADDIVLAAQKAAFGAFYNQGEVCSANSTILVEESILDEFTAAFLEATKDYEPGDPFDVRSGNGALVSSSHADSVLAAIAEGAASGTILAGGMRQTITGSDAYVSPTVIAGLDERHPIHRKEIFGPVVTITAFASEDEAIRRANATSYGLAASVWTGSLARAHRVSRKLIAGTVSVNTVDAIGLTTPFGGFKQSGFGRDLSVHALDNYSGLKTTWFQHG